MVETARAFDPAHLPNGSGIGSIAGSFNEGSAHKKLPARLSPGRDP
jgi:hypothetical protein